MATERDGDEPRGDTTADDTPPKTVPAGTSFLPPVTPIVNGRQVTVNVDSKGPARG